ncbi:MAG TPA: hypothetical protein V6C85_32775 [Allocoleopsis sp.]
MASLQPLLTLSDTKLQSNTLHVLSPRPPVSPSPRLSGSLSLNATRYDVKWVAISMPPELDPTPFPDSVPEDPNPEPEPASEPEPEPVPSPTPEPDLVPELDPGAIL